ncbi:MAG: hypothetical protein ACRCU3_06715 [Eubacteriaceae bacterium]
MKLKELKKWQKIKLFFSVLGIGIFCIIFLTLTTLTLYNDKINEESYWTSGLLPSPEAVEIADILSPNATVVSVGTYLENIKEINLKNSLYRPVMLVWFRWEGDPDLDMMNNYRIYKGTINKQEVVKDYHENNINYQLIRIDVSITKNYWTKRFPLESHQIRCYIESEIPANKVVFIDDKENSGYNPSLGISGYALTRVETGALPFAYESNHGDPEFAGTVDVNYEHVTAVELNRDGFGLYLKCFIALLGTCTWVLIILFICTYHKVDPLSMIPAALFGTVSNILIGANLLPDALDAGLLEYVNIWGIMTILSVAITIITINRIRAKYEDRDFAMYYGRVMFSLILFFVLLGNILLPLSAYIF